VTMHDKIVVSAPSEQLTSFWKRAFTRHQPSVSILPLVLMAGQL
jgi:hypothetical protein